MLVAKILDGEVVILFLSSTFCSCVHTEFLFLKFRPAVQSENFRSYDSQK